MVSTNPPYANGDERLYSDIVYSDGSVVTGIKNASADAKAMSVTYYDLSGRKVELLFICFICQPNIYLLFLYLNFLN